jgi:5-methyltetrahydrofolate--homocysteine methyltransferase
MQARSLDSLHEAIVNFRVDQAVSCTEQAIAEGIDPISILAVVTESMREIGDAYTKGELWLPELVGAADVVQQVMPIIEEKIAETGRRNESAGNVVIGTVSGDIHTIGKGMVASLLIARGFTVHDIGTDVAPEAFLAAVNEYDPDILALSALLSVTAASMKDVLDALTEAGLKDRVKVMVGGGAVTEELAKKIGADGYAPTAPEAVDLAAELVGR